MKPRRPKGEGTYQTIKGKIRLVKVIDGKKIAGPLAPTKQAALKAFQEKERELKLSLAKKAPGSQQSIENLVLELFPEDFPNCKMHPNLEAISVNWKSPNTMQVFRRHALAIASTELGIMYPNQITQVWLQAWVDRQTLAPKTVKNRVEALGTLLKAFGHPVPKVKLPMIVDKEHKIIMPGEWLEIEALANDMRERVAFALCYRLGMRRGEACGVRKEHYNPATQEIRVQAIAADTLEGVVSVPLTKTRKTRLVPVTLGWLREYIEGMEPGYLIPGLDDETPCSPGKITDLFAERLKGTKFEGITPQSLRRSAATAYALSGESENAAAAIMGHSSEMLRKTYTQVRHDVRKRIVDKAFGTEG